MPRWLIAPVYSLLCATHILVPHNTLLTNLWSTENIFITVTVCGATAGTHFRERHNEGERGNVESRHTMNINKQMVAYSNHDRCRVAALLIVLLALSWHH